MKKTSSAILLLTAFLFIISCKKEFRNVQDATSKDFSLVNDWLDKEIKSLKDPYKQKVRYLKESLDFSKLTQEDLYDGQVFIIVPIKPGFSTINNKTKNPINNLILIKTKEGNIRKANIYQFVPKAGTNTTSLPAGTINKIYNQKKITCDGTFTVLTTYDKFKHELGFENGELSTTSVMLKNTPAQGTTNGMNNADLNTINQTCIEWYLVTTHYWTDGSTFETREFIGETCFGSGCGYTDANGQSVICDEFDDEGLGGGSTNPEPEILTRVIDWIVAERMNAELEIVWYVNSYETLKGVKIAGEPFGGHFIENKHIRSEVFNFWPNTNLLHANWMEINAISSNGTIASPTSETGVQGKITYSNGISVAKQRGQTWNFLTIFP